MTPAEELRHAAFLLLNPLRQPGLCAVVNLDFTEPLIQLLETAAEYVHVGDTPTHPTHVVRALAVARAINTQEQP
ncbi:hypothetical protein ACFYQQ_01090 [Streptomyces sp. NPDC005496]|uniref:hypothetical protein n=1 Tax=unclassified Streptomyces TaxID=2593676 RepID=UPI0033AD492A